MHAMLWAYFPFWINITPIYFCWFVYFLCFLKPQKIILEEKKTGNKGEIMWKIGADFSVTGGEIWLGCNNPSESKTLEENKHRAQNSPCYSLTAATSVDWADEMTFWRTGGKPQGQQQMGGLRVPDPTGAGPLNQLKSHQATLYHTRRDPLERGSDTYSHFDDNVSHSQVLQLCLLLLLEGKGNKNLTVYYFNQHIHRIPKGATSQHLAHCFLGTHCLIEHAGQVMHEAGIPVVCWSDTSVSGSATYVSQQMRVFGDPFLQGIPGALVRRLQCTVY